MNITTRKIPIGPDAEVSSVWAAPDDYRPGRDDALILAHGAGNDMHSPFLNHVHERLADRGVLTVKFNFPYKERGGKAPDRTPVLEATWRAVAAAVRADALAPARLFLGGKSMGGRMATHLAAAGEACAGLVLLGYPLHPARKPERLRDEHLPRIACPMLFIEGTRDPLCDLDLLRGILKTLPAPVQLHVIDGGDHSFKPPKRMGRAEPEVWDEIVTVTAEWMSRV
jgi:hypothetical protein